MVAAIAEPHASQQFALLDAPGFHFNSTGLQIDSWVEYEEWEVVGRKLANAERAVQWWIGDWIRHGEKAYGEKYSQAIELSGLKKQTLMNYAFVSKAFKETSRRREDVDFSTHAEVASLPEPDQDRILAKAAGDPLISSRDVRKEARRVKKRLNLIPDEVDLLHAPEIQEYLDGYIDGLKLMEAAVPSNAMFLRGMIQAHIGQAQWQKERTVESDCAAILDTFDEAYTQTDQDIYTHLTSSGHFISDPDLDDRLELMVRNHQLKRVKTGGRQDTRRGDMVDLYMLYNAPTGDAANVRKGSSVYDMGERE